MQKMMRLALVAAAMLGCGNQPQPATAQAPAASAPTAVAQPAPSAAPPPSAVASAAPPPSASVVASAAPTAMASVDNAGAGAPLDPDGSYVSAPKSVTTVGTVTGGGADAESAVKKTLWRFKTCHNRYLAEDPSMAGTVKLVVIVDKEGAVTAATVNQTSVPPNLTACVLVSAKKMKFAATAKPEPISFTLTFKPSK